MPVTTEQVVRIPLPNDIFMVTNKQVITGIDDSGIVKYTPNGEYEITASSYASGDTQPYVIANENTDDYWQSDFKGNPNYINGAYSQYTQNPYIGGGTPSSYQGGGSNPGNTWTTPVGSSRIVNVRGEWIQVHIPFNAYIQQYVIQTPTYTQYNTFPRKFMLVASKDGKAWTQIDQRNLKEDYFQSGDTKHTFDINSPEKYSYFRLIVMGMGPFIETVKINNFILYGTTMVTVNPRTLMVNPPAIAESFITLSRSLDVDSVANPSTTYDGINMYDRQYGKYHLDKKVHDVNTLTKEGDDVAKDVVTDNAATMTYILATSILAGSMLAGLFIYKIIRR